MKMKIGVVMDPIAAIKTYKDSTFAMLLEAQRRNYEIYYFELKNLFVRNGKAYGMAKILTVNDDANNFFEFTTEITLELAELSAILMRKDPPFNMDYIYATYILDLAEKANVLVVNKPQSLRDANEKMVTNWFKEFTPPTIVSKNKKLLAEFHAEQQNIICKPLDVMGGTGIFKLEAHDHNANAVFDVLTQNENQFIMAQRFIPEIKLGDKRVLLINGEPVPYVLNRIPQANDWRGNLATGAKGIAEKLSEHDRKLCEAIGPVLKARGLYFAGIDIIGDYLTEINVTSPTGIRELDTQCNINIAAILFDFVESTLK